jgi:transposase
MRLADRNEPLKPKKSRGRVPKTNETTQRLLEGDIEERPAATIDQRRLFLEKVGGQSLSVSTVKRLLKKLGYSQKNGQWERWNGTSSKEPPGG